MSDTSDSGTDNEQNVCGLCFGTDSETNPIPLSELSETGGLGLGVTETQQKNLYAMVCASCRTRYVDTEAEQGGDA